MTLIAKGKGSAREVLAQLEGEIDITVVCKCEEHENYI